MAYDAAIVQPTLSGWTRCWQKNQGPEMIGALGMNDESTWEIKST